MSTVSHCKMSRKPQVVLSTLGKFHTFSLARQLLKKDMLISIYTSYPMVKLKNEGLPERKIKTRSAIRILQYAIGKFQWLSSKLNKDIDWCNRQYLARFIVKNITKDFTENTINSSENTDIRSKNNNVYVGLSGHCLPAAKKVKASGGIYICDRGSSHIETQNEILYSEYQRFNIPFPGIDQRHIDIELAEYALADRITVPSTFAYNSFIERGISAEKLRIVPYGVELSKFTPTMAKSETEFTVTFVGNVSFQKGIPDLITAFNRVVHPNKVLNIVGPIDSKITAYLAEKKQSNIVFHGAVQQTKLKDIYSRSHVFCLPSLQEGLAMVMAEAMACGCPVIATENTGAFNLFEDGKEGFIIPIRSPELLAEKIQLLADTPDLAKSMSVASLQRVKSIGGWDRYGELYCQVIEELLT